MTFDEAREIVGVQTPNPDEERNGWTKETLTVYVAERAIAAHDRIWNPPQKRPRKTISMMKWLW